MSPRKLIALAFSLVLGLISAACDGPEAPPKESSTVDNKTAPTWKAVEHEELTKSQRDQLERAKKAQKQLGKTLVGALSQAVAEDGFPAAIKVCNTAAPEIAEKVHRDSGVKIGRTSFKLRNPDNEPPTWAKPYVEERRAEPVVLRGNGHLAYMAPIKMGELCVNCHGPQEKLAEGVSAKLAELYPQDEATGFEAGDLRGWFWIEVPKG